MSGVMSGSADGSAFLAQLPQGCLADNVLYFVRVLRAAGLPVGPAKVIDALGGRSGRRRQPHRLSGSARRGACFAARTFGDLRAGVRSVLAQSATAREN